MTTEVLCAVLLGALLHAAWNAMIRRSSDGSRDTVLVVCAAAFIAALALPFTAAPARASWPYLAASGLIHVVYFMLVARAYRHAELSFAYPVMRGTAPALSALAAALLLAEWPAPGHWLGIAMISGGVVLMAADSWRQSHAPKGKALLFPLVTAATIVVYTLVDGTGTRLSGNAAAYTAWVFLLTALPLLALSLARDARDTAQHWRKRWPYGLIGGACTLGSYGLALWAMTQAPIGLVAALRETSVAFGVLIAVAVLGERISRNRWIALAVIVCGSALIKLA